MAASQNFLDNLENLRLVMTVALEHVQANRDQFVTSCTWAHMLRAERSITKIRALAEQLERDLNKLEYLIAKRQSSSRNSD